MIELNDAKRTGHVGVRGQENLTIVSKLDPRHWLKDMPSADLFSYQWLACDEDGSWFYYSSEPEITRVNYRANGDASTQSGHLDCIKMPTLTGDEWKSSKISIPELKEWQDEYINSAF